MIFMMVWIIDSEWNTHLHEYFLIFLHKQEQQKTDIWKVSAIHV